MVQNLYTVEDLRKRSHLARDDERFELLNGRLLRKPPAGELWGIVTAWVSYLVFSHVESNDLGNVLAAGTGFHLTDDPDSVFAPDIAFISEARRQPTTTKYLRVAPDLAVEVISPGNTASEINDKITAYFAAGIKLVWILYSKTKTIHVYTSPQKVEILTVNDMLTGGDVLPEFSISVREIFKKIKR